MTDWTDAARQATATSNLARATRNQASATAALARAKARDAESTRELTEQVARLADLISQMLAVPVTPTENGENTHE